MIVKYTTFREFWPFYVREHSQPLNRALHVVGTSLFLSMAIAALVTGRYWLFALCPLFGYGFAWFGHFVIEKNRPATFKYPFFSFAADFVMIACIVTGRMPREIAKATGQAS